MKLLTGFLTEQDAMDKSELWFVPYKHPTSTSQYLCGWTQHPENLDWALVIPDDYVSLLPQEDQDALESDTWPRPALQSG